MIKKTLLALGALTAMTAPAFADSNMDFKFDLKGDYFKVDLKLHFTSGSLEDIKKVMKDSALFPRLSDLVVKVVQSGPDSNYYLYATAKKMGLEQTSVGLCKDSEVAGVSWAQDCTLALNKGNTGRFWVSGKNSIHCAQGSPVICDVHVEGQPKAINIPLVYSRTAQQLAIGGASQSLRDYGVMLGYVNEKKSPASAQAAFPNTQLNTLRERMFKEGRDKIDAGLAGKRLMVQGSGRSNTYSLQLL